MLIIHKNALLVLFINHSCVCDEANNFSLHKLKKNFIALHSHLVFVSSHNNEKKKYSKTLKSRSNCLIFISSIIIKIFFILLSAQVRVMMMMQYIHLYVRIFILAFLRKKKKKDLLCLK